jgi:hypothetical protein
MYKLNQIESEIVVNNASEGSPVSRLSINPLGRNFNDLILFTITNHLKHSVRNIFKLIHVDHVVFRPEHH